MLLIRLSCMLLALSQVYKYCGLLLLVLWQLSRKIMYRNLGVAWTLTVLGSISFLALPVPFVLYWKGPQVRARSRYARRNEA